VLLLPVPLSLPLRPLLLLRLLPGGRLRSGHITNAISQSRSRQRRNAFVIAVHNVLIQHVMHRDDETGGE
jgi:hypothetical protein